MQITLNGKTVTYRDKFPAKQSWPLMQLFDGFKGGLAGISFEMAAGLLAAAVDTWEYEGDPHDLASYENLDLFGEMIPMLEPVTTIITRRAEPQKN